MPAGGSRYVAALLTTLLQPLSIVAAEPDWMLMSRHGDCFGIDQTLGRRFNGLPPIATPDEFAQAMRSRNIAVSIKRAPEAGQDAVVIELPDREMSLIFVPRSRCTAIVERKK